MKNSMKNSLHTLCTILLVFVVTTFTKAQITVLVGTNSATLSILGYPANNDNIGPGKRFSVNWSNGIKDTYTISGLALGEYYVTVVDGLTGGCTGFKKFVIANNIVADISQFKHNSNGWTAVVANIVAGGGWSPTFFGDGAMTCKSVSSSAWSCDIFDPFFGGCLFGSTKYTYNDNVCTISKTFNYVTTNNLKVAFSVLSTTSAQTARNCVKIQLTLFNGAVVNLPNDYSVTSANSYKSYTVDLSPYITVAGPFSLKFIIKSGLSQGTTDFGLNVTTAIDDIKVYSDGEWKATNSFDFTDHYSLNDDTALINKPGKFKWKIRKDGTNDTVTVLTPKDFLFPNTIGTATYQVLPKRIENGVELNAVKSIPSYLPIYLSVLGTGTVSIPTQSLNPLSNFFKSFIKVNSLRFGFYNEIPSSNLSFKINSNGLNADSSNFRVVGNKQNEFFVSNFSLLGSNGKLTILNNNERLVDYTYNTFVKNTIPASNVLTSFDNKLTYSIICPLSDTVKFLIAKQNANEIGEPEDKFDSTYVLSSSEPLVGNINLKLDTNGLGLWKSKLYDQKIRNLDLPLRTQFNALTTEELLNVFIRNDNGSWEAAPASFDASTRSFNLNNQKYSNAVSIGIFYNKYWQSSDLQSSSSSTFIAETDCPIVRPGDVNTDGRADNIDVLELGLHYNQVGKPRRFISNNWEKFFAYNWLDTISNGKNLNNSDCNGDGTIDTLDLQAIGDNYGKAPILKVAQTTTLNQSIKIVPDQDVIEKGKWGSASIFVGDNNNKITDVNGLAFTVNFDNALINTDSIYIQFINSFIDLSDENLTFAKLKYTDGKIYAATTHTDNINGSGFGKIAILHYKASPSITKTETFTVSVSGVNKSDALGNITALGSGLTSTVTISLLPTGLSESLESEKVQISPNPTNGLLIVKSKNILQKIEVFSITGQALLIEKPESTNHVLNLENLSNGIYFINIYQNNLITKREKIILNR
ncbi:MAG: T9SS type A sorting domain-containing protein [Bacteroidota bacterium]